MTSLSTPAWKFIFVQLLAFLGLSLLAPQVARASIPQIEMIEVVQPPTPNSVPIGATTTAQLKVHLKDPDTNQEIDPPTGTTFTWTVTGVKKDGVSISTSGVSTTNGQTTTVTASFGASGNYEIDLHVVVANTAWTDSSGNPVVLTADTSLSVAVSDFSLQANPPSLTIAQGSGAGFTVTIVPINGFDDTVTGTPSCNGPGVSFPGNSNQTYISELAWEVAVSSSTPPTAANSHYTISVTVTDHLNPSLSHSIQIPLKVIGQRGINISASIDDTSYPGVETDTGNKPISDDAGDPIYIPKPHVRAPDGSMAGDIGIDLVTTGGKDGTASGSAPIYPNVTYTANRFGVWSLNYDKSKWTSSKSGSPSDTCTTSSPNISPLTGDYFGDYYYTYNYDLYPSQKTPGNFGGDGIAITYTDGTDAFSASNTYGMTTHEAYEGYYDNTSEFSDTAHPFEYKNDKTSESSKYTSPSQPFVIGLSAKFQETIKLKVGLNVKDLPIPFIKLLPIDISYELQEPIDYSSIGGYTVYKPYQYSYLVVLGHYKKHKGANLHYDLTGYKGESRFDIDVPSGYVATLGPVLTDTTGSTNGGGQPAP